MLCEDSVVWFNVIVEEEFGIGLSCSGHEAQTEEVCFRGYTEEYISVELRWKGQKGHAMF